MSADNFLNAFSDKAEVELRIAGLMHAIQTLAAVLIETPDQKARLDEIVEALSERAFDADLNQDQKDAYLNGLSSLKQAANLSDH